MAQPPIHSTNLGLLIIFVGDFKKWGMGAVPCLAMVNKRQRVYTKMILKFE